MDRRDPDVVAIVTRMKIGARGSPWVPSGVVPGERYHHFPDGLSLCLTLDILNKLTKALGEGGKFWHLSIARPGGRKLTPEEVEFWPRAFFEEEPIFQMQGLVSVANSRHFFWRTE
ncbi:hypothetical protein ES703_99301 [subsurface metagenome]